MQVYNKDKVVPCKCSMLLDEEIAAVNPLVVVTLGMLPTKAVLDGALIKHMMDVAGRPILHHIGNKEICVYPMYHPNWVLREDTPEQIEIRNTVFKQMFLDLILLVEKRRNANAAV
jgi:uracil-DNA glycosylase family 4